MDWAGILNEEQHGITQSGSPNFREGFLCSAKIAVPNHLPVLREKNAEGASPKIRSRMCALSRGPARGTLQSLTEAEEYDLDRVQQAHGSDKLQPLACD